MCRPDPGTTNLAKYTFATGYHEAVRIVQECAGGLLVTGPGGEDWDSAEVRPVLEKYFRAAAPAAERLAMMNTIADLTVHDFGGYQAVLAVHAEGSIEAEKMQILREYDKDRAVNRARYLAGLGDDAAVDDPDERDVGRSRSYSGSCGAMPCGAVASPRSCSLRRIASSSARTRVRSSRRDNSHEKYTHTSSRNAIATRNSVLGA